MENHIKFNNNLLERHIFLEKDTFPPIGRIIKTVIPKSKHFISLKRRPLMLICETVNICNNDCLICAHSLMKRKKEIMSLELFKKVLQDYSDIGGGKLSLTPMIGDIFLDKLFIDRIKLIPQYPKITGLSVTTNAVASDLFSDAELTYVLENFERLHISIYGLDDEEYQVMTRRNHYLRMLKNVKRIIDISKNKTSIVFGFRFLKDHSEGEIKTWIQQNFGSEIPFNYTKTFSNWGNKIDTSIRLPFNGEWTQYKENTMKCLVPVFACQIFSNGDVSFCACPDFDIDDDLKLGNIKDNSLIDIYNSKKCQQLWDSDKKIPDFCKYCSFFKPFTELSQYERAIENPIDFIGG
jgi:radical SAM protein with 4Fe4S-binding SPASM domain